MSRNHILTSRHELKIDESCKIKDNTICMSLQDQINMYDQEALEIVLGICSIKCNDILDLRTEIH